jgi:capsular exopolysaccharide synthesis family protein
MNNRTNHNNNFSEPSDLKKNIKLLLSKWFWFPISIMVAILIVRTFNNLITPSYIVNCKIVIGDDLTESLSTSEIIGTTNGIDFNRMNPINKEIGILRSRKLAEETIDSLRLNYHCYELNKGGKYFNKRLYSNIPFYISLDSTDSYITGKEIIIKIPDPNNFEVSLNGENDISKVLKPGQKFDYDGFSFGIGLSRNLTDLNDFVDKRYSITFKSKYALATEYIQKLNVDIDPTSQNIIKLSIRDENINQSIAFLNMLCEIYINNDIKLRNTMASKTIEYIDLQLKILSEQLKNAEDSLINFNRKFDAILSNENSFLIQNYMQVNKDLENIKLQEQSLDELIKNIRIVKNNKNTVLPGIILINNKFQNQLDHINKLIIQREILLKNQTGNSPEVTLNQQELEVNILKLTDVLVLEKRLLTTQKNNLRNQLFAIEKELIKLPENQRKKLALERKFNLTENLYNTYQQKRIEAILAKESTVSKIRVLDPARYEDHYMVSPRKNYNFRLAIILSLFFPAFLILVIKNFSNKVSDLDEVKQKSNLTILGKIFHSDIRYELPAIKASSSPIAESFYKLYARLKFLKPEPGVKIISITSGASGEGKTFCSSNLAASIALSGKKVILLSLDLRKPKIHEIFNIKISPGFTNFFLGKVNKKDIIYSTEIENLDIIPSGPIPPDPIKLISQNLLKDLLDDLSKTYDYIIIDTPPIGMVADALMIGKLSDLMVMLIRIKFTQKAIFELIQELEESDKFENLAIVVNDMKEGGLYNDSLYYQSYQKNEKLTFREKLRKFKLS